MLHPEVRVNVTLNVARTEDEAERQARGEPVVAAEVGEGTLSFHGASCLPPSSHPEALAVFREASRAMPGTPRDDLWRKAGAMYEAALRDAPEIDGAADAALHGAAAYEHVGDLGRAIALY